MAFNDHIAPISYAVRLPVIAKYTGQIALVSALLCGPPMIVSLLFAEYDFSVRYLIITVLLGAAGGFLARLPVPAHIQVNEGLVITALSFVVTPLLMSYPFMAAELSFMDALFEAVSGLTTTGLSTVASFEGKARTFLFARAWLQWCGGLGIVVLSVSLLMGHQAATRRLIGPEASALDLVSTIRTYARRVVAVYVLLSLIGLAAVWFCVRDGFTALNLTLSAVSTGGFSPFNDSLASLDRQPSVYVVMFIGLACAITLPAYYRVFDRGWRSLLKDIEFQGLLVMTVGIGFLLTISLKANMGMSWWDASTHGALLGISAQSTTGFSTVPIDQLDTVSRFLLIPSMFIGGSVGSTAGGIKLLRLLIFLRLLHLWLLRTGTPPHAVTEPWLAGRRLENDELMRALSVISLFALAVLLSWLVFVIFGHDPLDALFEVVSATGTVGLSTGITGPELHPFLKGVLCLNMLAGRLEVLALLVLLYPKAWFGKRVK